MRATPIRRPLRHALTCAAFAPFLWSELAAAPLDPNAYASIVSGAVNVTAGTFAFDTSAGTLTITGSGVTGIDGTHNATIQNQGAGLPEIAVYTFDDLAIANGVTLTFQGSRPIAILSKGDALVDPAINVFGFNGAAGGSSSSSGFGGAGRLGGGKGGGADGIATGTGRGGANSFLLRSGSGAGFGGVGGAGGSGSDAPVAPGGSAYGDLSIALEGGSGGGGDLRFNVNGGGGAGGGAIEIGALGTVALGQGVNAHGGRGATNADNGTLSGGGGSGGAILLHGSTVTSGDTLDVGGGNAAGRIVSGSTTLTSVGGGGGGGGRILIEHSAAVTLGGPIPFDANVSGGAGQAGTGTDGGSGNPGVAGLAPGLAIVPVGQVLTLAADGSASIGNGWTLKASNRRVEAGGFMIATVPFTSGHDLDLQGGSVFAGAGWTMEGDAQLSGFGTVSGPFSGGATNAIHAAGGTLTLGDAGNANGFAFTGETAIHTDATLSVQDADTAVLGHSTTMNEGARLASLNGIELGAEKTLEAFATATVSGRFTNQGTVSGPTSTGQTLTFTDDVDGAGGYNGNIVFSDGFSPGNSPAAINISGNATYDATSEIVIELLGVTPGSGYDQINVFDDPATTGTTEGYLAIAGLVRVLLHDENDPLFAFAPQDGGVFDIFTALDIDLTGATFDLPTLGTGLFWQSGLFDAGGRETFRLTVAGQSVAAPAPAALALFGFGLFAFGALRRRLTL